MPQDYRKETEDPTDGSCILHSIQFDITVEAEKDTVVWILPADTLQDWNDGFPRDGCPQAGVVERTLSKGILCVVGVFLCMQSGLVCHNLSHPYHALRSGYADIRRDEGGIDF